MRTFLATLLSLTFLLMAHLSGAEEYISPYQQQIVETQNKIQSLDEQIKQARADKDKSRVKQLSAEKNAAKKQLLSLQRQEKEAQKQHEKDQAKQRAEALWETYPADKQLCTAIKFNRVDLAKRVLAVDKSLANVDTLNCRFPLGEAVQKDNLEMVTLLLDNGASQQMPLVMGVSVSALELAARNAKARVDLIELLIKRGAQVTGDGGDNLPSALVRQAQTAQEQQVKAQHQIEAEQLVNGGVLNRVVTKGHLANLEALLKHGANPNGFMMASSALMDAVTTLELERVKLLVQYGANVNLRGPGKETVLTRVKTLRTSNAKTTAQKQAILDYLTSIGATE